MAKTESQESRASWDRQHRSCLRNLADATASIKAMKYAKNQGWRFNGDLGRLDAMADELARLADATHGLLAEWQRGYGEK